MIVRSSLPQNVVVRHEISDSYIAKLFSFAQNVSSTRSSLKSAGRRFQPIVPLNKMLAIISDQQAEMRIENRPKHFVALHVLHSRGIPDRADAASWTHYADRGRRQRRVGSSGADCNGNGHRNASARIPPARNQSKIAHFKAAI